MAKAGVLKEDDERDVPEAEQIVIVEEDPKKAAAPEEDDVEDDVPEHRQAAADDEDDEHDGEREAIRERRRLEKLERKERRDKAIQRDKLELDFLRKRNDELERRVSVQEQRTHKMDLNQYDAQIQQAKQEADMADKVIAKAVAVGNGEDVTQALRYRDEAMARIQQLNQAKQHAQAPAQQQGMDELTLHHARNFLNENKWYNPNGADEDSAIVLAIDQSLHRDGYDPKSEEYWDELRRRAARRLPERFNARERTERDEPATERKPRGGPAVGSGREHAPVSTRREIYISPERKQALVDAGVWEDPVLRMKYVKRYAEYDRNNKA